MNITFYFQFDLKIFKFYNLFQQEMSIGDGCGLHLSPTIRQAMSFHDEGTYLACRVNLRDIANLPAYAEYPDKIRVRACIPLYQVDIEGKKISRK